MKFPLSYHPNDELAPLRELRSPLTTSAIRERVLERAAQPALWGQLRNILAECLVVGVAGAALLKMAGPVEVHYTSQATHRSYGTYRSDGTDRTNEVATAHTIGSFNSTTTPPERGNAINSDAHNSVVARPVAINNTTEISPSFTPHPSSFILQPSAFILHPSSFILPPSPIWFASASGGAIFSQIRMTGERGKIGFEDGWKTIALSYTSGAGSRDLRDELNHHSGATAPLLSKERDQEFSLLLGATTQAGPIGLRAMAGPAYLSSSSTYYSFFTGTTGAPISLQGFGAAAEISVLYPLNSSFEIAIDATANYLPRHFTSGLFASLEYRLGS
ncbi:MAG TPA: hypothetical protein VFD13_03380 [Candidatus Kapabacteria bacterium]|nr:hypothetical protein [Candidatus Kapabacteria bacterium]